MCSVPSKKLKRFTPLSNQSDTKPVAVNGIVMRRTTEHVLANNEVQVTKSGDSPNQRCMRNTVELAYPDSDPQWGSETPIE